MNSFEDVDLASSFLHKSRMEIRKNEVHQTDKQTDKQNPEVTNERSPLPHTATQTNHGAPARGAP